MAPLHRQLDILGIVVRPADNDQVLQTTRHVQLTLVDATQVTRAEERAPVVGPIERGLKCRPRLRRPLPVAHANTSTRDPYLADTHRRDPGHPTGVVTF